MVEDDENNKIGPFDLNSKFIRVILIIVSVFLIFAGPTYISYLLADVNYVVSVASGFAFFIAGLILMFFLIRKKVFT